MKEIQLVLIGLIAMSVSVIFFYLTDLVPPRIENREISIIISLGIGLLILAVDKRQDRNLHEVIHTQHEMINETHKMVKEEMNFIREMQRKKSLQLLVTTYKNVLRFDLLAECHMYDKLS